MSARPLPARPSVSSDTTGPPAIPTPVEAGERGTTTLADRVVEKIAVQAATEVPHALGLSRRAVGREFGRPAVRAEAQIDGSVTSLRLELAVQYPASARATTRSVREHVAERVTALCGLTVDHIDITVAVLRRVDLERKRVQ